jgi:hypothetical protein
VKIQASWQIINPADYPNPSVGWYATTGREPEQVPLPQLTDRHLDGLNRQVAVSDLRHNKSVADRYGIEATGISYGSGSVVVVRFPERNEFGISGTRPLYSDGF